MMLISIITAAIFYFSCLSNKTVENVNFSI
jgi:hypothetical protein